MILPSVVKSSVIASMMEIKALLSSPDKCAPFKASSSYIDATLPSYLRTVEDCHSLLTSSPSRILELGAYYSVVSLCLLRLGHSVTAVDIPSYFDNTPFSNSLNHLGIKTLSMNLRNNSLPVPSGSFDLIIACETFEHFNFNSILLLISINQSLTDGGLLYISMPNASSWIKRLRFLVSGSFPTFPITYFFSQLDPNDDMIVGLHWREYSVADAIQLIEPLGFKCTSSSLFTILD